MENEILTLIARVAKTGGLVRIGPHPILPDTIEIRVEIPGQTGEGGTDGITNAVVLDKFNGDLLASILGRNLQLIADCRHLAED